MTPLLEVTDSVDPADPALWWARRVPPPLVGMFAPPAGFRFQLLEAQGVGAVVSLIGPQTYDVGSMETYAFTLHDMYGGLAPADPVAERAELTAAAARVAKLVNDGVGVAVHCHAGIGRTGTVIGAVLVSLGYAHAEVAGWLDAVQRARGAPGWPESPWQLDSLDVLVRSP
jgi:hypothetical protein